MSFLNSLGYLSGVLRRNAPLRPPEEDVARAIAQYMAIPPKEPGSDREPVITDVSFQSIARYLRLSSDPYIVDHGSKRPRICTILQHISRIDALSTFVELGFTDFMLPISAEELPAALGPDKSKFIQIQNHCLTHASELEKGEEGRHVVLSSSQPFFVTMRDLGSGGFGYV